MWGWRFHDAIATHSRTNLNMEMGDPPSPFERIIILIDLDFFYGIGPHRNDQLMIFQAKSSKFGIHDCRVFPSSSNKRES